MVFKALKNERGATSILLTIGIAAISALVIGGMSSTFETLNSQRRHQKMSLKSSNHLLELSRLIKKSYTMGQLDPTCSAMFDRTRFRADTIGGQPFCIPRTGGLCVTDSETGENLCASLDPTALRIPVASTTDKASGKNNRTRGGTRGEGRTDDEVSEEDERGYRTGGSGTTTGERSYSSIVARHTRLRVPDATSPLWKNCDGPGDFCVRMVICPEEATSCSVNGGEPFQVLNLSGI